MTANIPDEIPSSLPEAEKLYTHLLGLLKEAQIKNPNIQLAGLASGGVWVAQRLAKDLGLSGYGVLNVSFHRDDYSAKGTSAINSSEGMSTNLPFSVEGAHIVLVDDVLDTGRTLRAALNELFDFGRPAKVELAVLADRYRRELPVEASYRGTKVLDLGDNQRLVLSLLSNGKLDFNTERKSFS